MKIVFLDIDGVLNSVSFLKFNQPIQIDEQRVELLAKLINETNASIVLHSGWRFWFDDFMEPQTDEAKFLCDLLSRNGIKLYAKTPDFSTEEIRKSKKFSLVKAQEIIAWLKEHNDIEGYVVLEDLNLRNDEIDTHQIRTDNYANGLSEIDVANAIKLLDKKT